MAKKNDDVVGVEEFLRRVMDAAGLKTQTALAVKVGVSQSTISKWIRGEQDPFLKHWNKVLAYVKGNPKTAHLLSVAPDFSLDSMVAPYGPNAEIGARLIIEGYLQTFKKS